MRNTLSKDMQDHPVFWATWAVLLISALFLIVPELDRWTSQLFYSAQDGFWLKNHYIPLRMRALGLFLPRAAILLVLGLLLARLFWPALQKLFALSTLLYLAVTALLGPGLLVNILLKANWGRARPVQTDLFGGTWPYSEVWVVTDHCQSNCSFVSGEASMAFWLVGLVLILPLGWRKGGALVLATLGLLVSLNRIAFGGHFLSDVLLAWALTGWVMVVLFQLMSKAGWFGPGAEGLEQHWTAVGRRITPHIATLWQRRPFRSRNQPLAPDEKAEPKNAADN
nr:phosphatase PAP2 family protein [uncultured Cohaesibacter sp.]